jgi:hypothetical protein
LSKRVDQWLAELDAAESADVDAGELASFSARLRELKSSSIKRSVRALVAQYAPGWTDDTSNEDFAAACYDVRSALVHGSLPVPEVRPMAGRLREIVAAAIRGMAET